MKNKLILSFIFAPIIIGAIFLTSTVHANAIEKEFEPYFSDVAPGDWAYESIQTMADIGVVSGFNDGTFRPDNELTWAEALVVLSRVAELETYNLPDTAWYTGVEKWFMVHGLIDKYQPMGETITREEVIELINKIYDIPDMELYNSKLFGINAEGEEPFGRFMLQDSLTRGALCEIIKNIIDGEYPVRDFEHIEIDYINGLTTYPIPIYELPVVDMDAEKLREVILWAVQNNLNTYTYEFELPSYIYDEFMDKYWHTYAVRYYSEFLTEYYLFFDKSYFPWIFSTAGKETTKFKYSVNLDVNSKSIGYRFEEMIQYYEPHFREMVHMFGLDDSKTTKQKAEAAYKYLAMVLEYDYDNYTSINFEDNTATCAGYTAMFNYMLTRMGIENRAVTGYVGERSRHAWNLIYDDATDDWYTCDATWGDGALGEKLTSLKWFWLTWDEVLKIDPDRVADEYMER